MKRTLALILTFLMLISCVPTVSFGADDITVYISVAENGSLVNDKNGNLIANSKVTLTGENPTLDDAFFEFHKQYSLGGEADYNTEESEWGLSVTKFLGTQSYNISFYVNHGYVPLSGNVNDKDYIVFFFYKDTTTWSDKYVKFDETSKTVKTGEIFKLTLTDSENNGVSGAKITINGAETESITDENGKVTLTFENEGEYIISAVSETEVLVPPVCVVTAKDIIEDGDDSKEEQPEIPEDPQPSLKASANDIIKNIAAKYKDKSNEWHIMDMAAYEDTFTDAEDILTSDAKQNYINSAISKILETTDEATLAKAITVLTSIGIDCEKLYAANSNTAVNAIEKLKNVENNSLSAWTAPYVIMALSQKNYDEEKVNYLIDEILKLQKEDGSFEEYGYIIDTTANMIACLSLYYDTIPEVKTTLDKAVEYLSFVQKEDGTFDAYGYGADTNTTSMVIVALSSLGINPDTDERFIKNGISVYDTLFKYALDDLSGFGYQNKTFNDYSTEQAFRAIISAVNVINNNEAYNIYDFSKNTLEPGRATSTGTVVRPSIPDTEDTISVVFTLKGKINSYWISNKILTLKKGSTIYHALTDACDSAGITYKGAEDGYVYEMTKGGETLSEFGEGANSGWLYKVNGEVLNIGILEYELENNDRIVFFYTTDWETVSGVTISGSQTQKDKVTATNVKNEIAKLKEVTLDDEEKINKLLEDYEKLSQKDKKKVNNYEELLKAKAKIKDLKFEKEREEVLSNITDISSHWAEDSISYVVKKGYMNGTGEKNFSPEENLTREMLVTILYRVAGEPETDGEIKFSDVDEEWCKNAVIWASDNKIVNGINENDFGCGIDMTREEFVTMLMRFSNGKAEKSDVLKFEDIKDVSDWAFDAFLWATDNGIIMGKENNTIAPKDKITRAEAATLIQRYIELKK